MAGKQQQRSFDLHSQAGVARLLQQVRNSSLPARTKSTVRELILKYTQSGGDAGVREELESMIAGMPLADATGITVVPALAKKQSPAATSKSGSRTRRAAGFAGARPVPHFTPNSVWKAEGRKEVSVPSQSDPAPTTSTSVFTAPPAVAFGQNAVQAPESASEIQEPLAPEVAPAPDVSQAASVPTPLPEPISEPVAQVVSELIPKQSAPEVPAVSETAPSAPASKASGDSYRERILDIKREVIALVGNPVNLIDINNEVGKRYMTALLNAMKRSNNGTKAQIEAALTELESAFEAVKAVTTDVQAAPVQQDAAQPPTLPDIAVEHSVSDVEQPVVPESGSEPQPHPFVPEEKVVLDLPEERVPEEDIYDASTPVSDTGVDVNTSPVIPKYEASTQQELADTHTPEGVGQAVSPSPVVPPPPPPPPAKSVTPAPVLDEVSVPARDPESIVASKTESLQEITSPEPADIDITEPAAPISADELRNAGTGLSESDQTMPVVPDNESSAVEVATSAESGAAEIELHESAPSERGIPLQDIPDYSTPDAHHPKRAFKTLEEVQPASMTPPAISTDTNLQDEMITQGLEQLLNEWKIFDKSGLFGMGPKGINHPLYEEMRNLSMITILNGTYRGATAEVTSSVNDYINGWRYEQAIVPQHTETFDNYLRRVVRKILVDAQQ